MWCWFFTLRFGGSITHFGKSYNLILHLNKNGPEKFLNIKRLSFGLRKWNKFDVSIFFFIHPTSIIKNNASFLSNQTHFLLVPKF